VGINLKECKSIYIKVTCLPMFIVHNSQ
jgi:hypothetical protein